MKGGKIVKKHILGLIVSLASIVTFIGIYPTSWGHLYQPEFPKELLK
ncbi:cyclic lactone autoinducer peptide [Pelotomaculum sp. FP]|nr:cyclic lactone autoinducer peptide [Pelotomaculum sp. FP]